MADLTPLFGVPIQQGIDTSSQHMLSGVDPSAILQARQSMQSPDASHHYVEQSGKHKGVAGVARDILGTLGDFLLTRLHMPAMYGPGQQDRKLTAAMQGFNDDPMAAIDRVADVDPDKAIKLRDQWNDNQRLQAQLQSTDELRKSREASLADAMRTKSLGRVAGYMNRIGELAPEKRPAAYAAARNLWSHSSALTGDPEALKQFNEEYPENYDEDMLTSSVGQYVPVATQWNQRLTATRDANATADRKTAEKGRNDRFDKGEAGKNMRFEEGETGKNNRFTQGEAGKNNRLTTTEAGKNTRANLAHPVRYQTIDGVRYGFELRGKDWVNTGPASN